MRPHAGEVAARRLAAFGVTQPGEEAVGRFIRPHGWHRPATPLLAEAILNLASARSSAVRRWFDGALHCLRLSQEGTRIFWRRDDGETGTASIASRSERQLAAREIPRQQPARVNEARAFVALQKIKKSPQPFQLIITDIRMPSVGGLAFLSERRVVMGDRSVVVQV